MTLATTVKMSVSATKVLTNDLGSGSINSLLSSALTLTDGSGASQANVAFADSRTLAASASESLDPATGGGLTDVSGAAVAMARIKAIAVKASTGNTNNVIVSRPASNGIPLFDAASDAISLAPGEVFLWASPTAAGKVVTAATADLISFANSAGTTSVSYDVIIIGASA